MLMGEMRVHRSMFERLSIQHPQSIIDIRIPELGMVQSQLQEQRQLLKSAMGYLSDLAVLCVKADTAGSRRPGARMQTEELEKVDQTYGVHFMETELLTCVTSTD